MKHRLMAASVLAATILSSSTADAGLFSRRFACPHQQKRYQQDERTVAYSADIHQVPDTRSLSAGACPSQPPSGSPDAAPPPFNFEGDDPPADQPADTPKPLVSVDELIGRVDLGHATLAAALLFLYYRRKDANPDSIEDLLNTYSTITKQLDKLAAARRATEPTPGEGKTTSWQT